MNKKLWDSIYGNTAVKNTFMSDIENGRLSHAFIIEGIEGSGKLTLARTVIASMQNDDIHVQQIMNGVCSDVFEIDVPDDKKKISVDAVRFIRTSSVIKAGDLDVKAYIIKNSEMMTPQAQNAFLKILEEPSPGVYFFLLTTNAFALLPTVRSRAPIVRTEIFSAQDIKNYLIDNVSIAEQLNKQNPERLDALIHRSGGSIGCALRELEHLSQGKFSSESSVTRVLDAIKNANRFEVLSVLNEVCSSREDTEQFLITLRSVFRDMMIIKSHADADTALGQIDILEDFAFGLSVNRILTLDMKIESMIFELEHFPNMSSFRLSVFKTLWEGLR